MAFPLTSRMPTYARLPNREGFQLVALVDRYGEALYQNDANKATDIARDILIVAARAYAVTAQLALKEQANCLLLQQNNQINNRKHYHHAIKGQPR